MLNLVAIRKGIIAVLGTCGGICTLNFLGVKIIEFEPYFYFLRKLPKTVEICLKKSRPGGSLLVPVYLIRNENVFSF